FTRPPRASTPDRGLDVCAAESDIAEAAVVELAELLHRPAAFHQVNSAAPQRGNPAPDKAKWEPDQVLHGAGARRLRLREDLLLHLLALVRRQGAPIDGGQVDGFRVAHGGLRG